MANPNLPPPGVSSISGSGGRTTIPTEKRPAPPRHDPRADPLADPSKYRVVSDSGDVPLGASRTQREVLQGPMPKTRNSERRMTSFKSVDGRTYKFRTHDAKGKPLESRIMQCLFLAIIEQRKGGDPLNVFAAFKLGIKDNDDQVVFPVDPDYLNFAAALRSVGGEAAEEVEEDGFSLGD